MAFAYTAPLFVSQLHKRESVSMQLITLSAYEVLQSAKTEVKVEGRGIHSTTQNKVS